MTNVNPYVTAYPCAGYRYRYIYARTKHLADEWQKIITSNPIGLPAMLDALPSEIISRLRTLLLSYPYSEDI